MAVGEVLGKERIVADAAISLPAVLVSRCLLGVPCRYHGKTHRIGKRIGRPALIRRLRKRYRIVDVCPECDAGLPTPRSPTRIVNGRWICNGQDVTAVFKEGAKIALTVARREGCQRAYLLRGSPACDRDNGTCGQLLREHGIRVISV